MSQQEPTSHSGRISEPYEDYIEHHAHREPRAELVEVVARMKAEHGDLRDISALEIGAGPMIEAKYLLQAGVGHLDAYDFSSAADKRAMGLALDYNDYARDIERFTFHKVRNEDLPEYLPEHFYDLVISYLTLQFTDREKFEEVWLALRASLKPGAYLSVQLNGDRHGWRAKRPQMTYLDRTELEALFAGMEDVQIQERNLPDHKLTNGQTEVWHDYWVTACQPAIPVDTRLPPENQV